MESLNAIIVFISPFLIKAGEKLSEKIVETVFDSHQTLADKYKSLFKEDMIALGIDQYSTTAEINKMLEDQPEIKSSIYQKIRNNKDLLDELIKSAQAIDDRITINAAKIAQININSTVTQTIENF